MAMINGKDISESVISKMIEDIKEKKELGALETNFIREVLVRELQSNSKILEFLSSHELRTIDRSGKYKEIIKQVRAKLRKIYGVFQTGGEKEKWVLLEELKAKADKTKNIIDLIEVHKSLLAQHLSSKERLPYYPEIYKKLWQMTGKPRSIIDLGCGLNPLSFPFMDLKKVDYYASELNAPDMKFLNAYFDVMEEFGLQGHAIAQDLSQVTEYTSLFKVFPKSDVALMFKLLDSLKVSHKSKNMDELILEKVPATWLVVSFPTKTIGQRNMNLKARPWIEKLCQRRNWICKHIIVGDEIFYIIKK
jgi:16S rRNA (guanine(1405)-N(7))-methyltransferase